MTDNNTIDALRMLKARSPYFSIYGLAGPSNKSHRQAIMATLVGHRVPIAECGINAIERKFYSRFQPVGNCIAARERHFAELAAAALRASSDCDSSEVLTCATN